MLNMGLRNLVLFFEDRTAVFLSFLAEGIIGVLYLLFIRDNLLVSLSAVKDAGLLVDVWMAAGILGVTSVTTTMGVYGIMLEDRVRKIDSDFHTSPLGRLPLLGGYMASASAVGMIMSVLVYVILETCIYRFYGVRLAEGRLVYTLGILAVTTIADSAMVLLLVSFLKSSNELAACSTILGALIGFLTGIYLPMGNLPQSVQQLVKCFPVSHGVVLLRQLLLEPYLVQSFGSADSPAGIRFQEYMGVRFWHNGEVVPVQTSIAILLAAGAVCLLTALWKLSAVRDH